MWGKLDAKKKTGLIQALYSLIGSLLFALGVNLIIVPLSLYNGGFMGLAQLIRTFIVDFLHVPVPAGTDLAGTIYFIMNIPLFYLGYRVMGRPFALKTLVTVAIQSIFMMLVPIPLRAYHQRLPDRLYHRRYRGRNRNRPDLKRQELRRRTGHHRRMLFQEMA